MTAKNHHPLTRPRKGELNHGKYCAQPGSLPVSDLPIQPSLKEQMQQSETMDKPAESMDSPETMVKIHCPLCGWQQEVEWGMWASASSKGGHGHTCGSGKCPSHTYMVLGEAPATMVNQPAVAFDHHSCILCDHVIVQKILGNKCKISGALCCNLKECPLEDRKKREARGQPAGTQQPEPMYLISETTIKRIMQMVWIDQEPDPDEAAMFEEELRSNRARGSVPAEQTIPEQSDVSCIRCFYCGKQVSSYHKGIVFRAVATCPECVESDKDIDPEHDTAIAAQATVAENKRVIDILLGKINACIKSCPSNAKQTPKTMLNYFKSTCNSLRLAQPEPKERDQE